MQGTHRTLHYRLFATLLAGLSVGPLLAQVDVNNPTIWSRAAAGVEGDYQTDDGFGAALAASDIEGGAVLVIGVPFDDSSAGIDHGSINTLGRLQDGSLFFGAATTQDSPSIPGGAESNDRFGTSVVLGDFDCDGEVETAVGVPGEALGSVSEAGAVNVNYLEKSGPLPQIWHQDSAGIFGIAETNDGFGGVLAVGDLDINGCDDLIISVLGEDIAGQQTTGGVHILYGTNGTGLTATNSQFLSFADVQGAVDGPNSGPFGWSLATLGFETQSPHWLAVGMPFYDGTDTDQGAVFTFAYNFSTQQLEWRDTSIGGAGAFFGYALESADFNGDNNDDLAIGRPGTPLGRGTILISEVSGGGLSSLIPGFSYEHSALGWSGELFGASMTAGDFNGDGRMDIAATSNKAGTSPLETAVHVAYQSGPQQAPVFITDMQLIEESDIPGSSGSGILFGLAMTAQDFNNDQGDELVIFSNLSQVIELPGSPAPFFSDDFETGDVSGWTSSNG